jgi:hypothetical protein
MPPAGASGRIFVSAEPEHWAVASAPRWWDTLPRVWGIARRTMKLRRPPMEFKHPDKARAGRTPRACSTGTQNAFALECLGGAVPNPRDVVIGRRGWNRRECFRSDEWVDGTR